MPTKNDAREETALLIDANALIHRAWHALPPLTAPDGRLVNAAYGFASVLLKVLATERPTYLGVCWDTPEPTYRHEAKPEYKAQREEQPDEFYEQIPLVKEIVRAFGGTNVELPGYEADDLLATCATRLAKAETKVTLLTSDKDAWQMIGPDVRVVAFKKGVSETVTYDEAMLKEVTGLTPSQIVDYKALRGDPSDNLSGVPGVGDKTATDLLVRFGDLDGVFTAAHDDASSLSTSVRRKLLEGEEEARSTYPIVRLDTDAPMTESMEDLRRRVVDEDVLTATFLSLGFKTLLGRALGSKPDTSTKSVVTASKTKAPAKGRTVKHLLFPTDNEILSTLDEAASEKRLILRTFADPRASLFRESPALALGMERVSLLLTERHMKAAKVKKKLKDLLKDASVKKVGHGLKNVWHWAHRAGFDLDGIAFDTEIASYLVEGGEGDHDLTSLALAMLETALSEADDRPLQEIDAIRGCEAALKDSLETQGLGPVFRDIEMPLIPILAAMEDAGILIDRTRLSKLSKEFRKEKTRLEQEMEVLAGEPFNAGSPQQLAHILFDVLKIPAKGIKRGKTGISTAASELEKLEGSHPIIAKISEYREVAKLLSTYVDALPALADTESRIHTTYNQTVTATGRLSSSSPNLQNIPIRTGLGRSIRQAFVAQKGYVLLSCDYSQIELRIVAALAKDERMTEAFLAKQDIHTATAAAIWGVPLENVTSDQRRAAKAVNFGVIYGQGPMGLSRSAGIPFEEAKRFIDEYFLVYSGIRRYLDATKQTARERGYVETLFGRRRTLADIVSPLPQIRAAAERMAINMPVQGTAADIMKMAMIRVADSLPTISESSCMLLQVHDELVFEVPRGDVDRVASSVMDIMEHVASIGVPLAVDAKVGSDWGEMTLPLSPTRR
ncbi:DNA polymerase I [Patescibacteria group bacterium]|nr:DNA polymerase I [Patescibacteria group bacterium]MBU2613342.1 DNA polymerase I [Patescibacteria group bacterium]